MPRTAALLLAAASTLTAALPAHAVPPAAPLPPAQPLAANVPSELPRTMRPSHYAIAITPDLTRLSFTGTETIDLQVFVASDAVMLHALELTIASASLVPAAGGRAVPLRAQLDEPSQTVRLVAHSTIAPGAYRLSLSYAGKIATQPNGLFALDYPDKRPGGGTVRALFTQFETADARRFAPMFDEPSYKATFDLTAMVPAALMAVGNMPAASETPLPGGLKRVTFGTSPRMSSYLLFFALGPFERVTAPAADGVEAGIVAPAGSGAQTRYPLASLAPLVGYYNDYFGQHFPLPKLDNVTGPGQSQSFGAMENWGAVFTFERGLLDDPAVTSAARRKYIFSTQAHEVAHQWFGDLVTMAWWGDIWLNEGFASWMETKATDHFNPTWYALLGRVGGREDAMDLDSLATTHPVVQPVRTVAEANQAFDKISYQKGEAVIAMLEAYAGEDTWRDGIRRYMAANRLSNTVSDDLWRAVEAGGGTPGLTDIAHDFTRQPGIPLVRAEASCAAGATRLRLTQGEFSADRRAQVTASPQHWRVPVLIAMTGSPPMRRLLEGQTEVALPGCGPVVVNGGQLGYFRTLYAPAMAAQLTKALSTLPPIDQIGLVRDNLALANAGYQPLATALAMLSAIPADANPVVAKGVLERWKVLGGLARAAGGAGEGQIAGLVRARWSGRLAQLGLDPRINEPLPDADLRATLIDTLGALRDPPITAEAHARFARLTRDPRALDGPLKETWITIAMRDATPAEWTQLLALARGSTSAVERLTYYTLLGQPTDPALAARALDLALTGEAKTTSAAIIGRVADSHAEQAFDFAVANRAKVNALVDSTAAQRFVPRLATKASDPAILDRLAALRTALSPDEQREVDRTVAALRQRFASEPDVRRQLAAWLAAQPGA